MLHGRFAAAFAGVVVGAAGLSVIGLAVVWPARESAQRARPANVAARGEHQRVAPADLLPKSSWGTVISMGANRDGSCTEPGPCAIEVILGPVSDSRRRLEISWTRRSTVPGAVLVARTSAMQKDDSAPIVSLDGRFMAACGVHLQGEGMNAIVISRKSCVPASAAKNATAWARFENTTPYARIVRFQFTRDALPRRHGAGTRR